LKPLSHQLVALALAWIACSAPAELRADDDLVAAKAYLEGKGLMAVGTTWVLPGEQELKQRIEGLDPFEKRYQAALRNAEIALHTNEQIRAQLATAEATAAREAARKNPPPAAPQAAAVAEAIELARAARKELPPPPTKLHSSLPDVTGLGELTPLQNAMVELVGARGALTLAVLKARQLRSRVETQYQALGRDSEVAASLKKLGAKHRLGPQRTDDRTAQRIDLLADQVLNSAVPVYWESQRFRLGVHLNDETPATFSYFEEDQNQPTLLTDSLAQTLGIVPAASSPKRTLKSGNQVLQVHEVQLPPLRIGKHVFTGVYALLLPPEAEDRGCQISAGALREVHAALEPRAMTLRISE